MAEGVSVQTSLRAVHYIVSQVWRPEERIETTVMCPRYNPASRDYSDTGASISRFTAGQAIRLKPDTQTLGFDLPALSSQVWRPEKRDGEKSILQFLFPKLFSDDC